MDLTSSCFACTPAELSKAADLTLTIKTNVSLRKPKKAKTVIIFFKTWNPGGVELVKSCDRQH